MPMRRGLSLPNAARKKKALKRLETTEAVQASQAVDSMPVTIESSPISDTDSNQEENGASQTLHDNEPTSAQPPRQRLSLSPVDSESSSVSKEVAGMAPDTESTTNRSSKKQKQLHEIPNTAKFVIHRMQAGKPTKVEEQMQLEITGFEGFNYKDLKDITRRLNEVEGDWQTKLKGTWDLHRHMQIFPASKIGVPKNKFKCETDWDLLLSDFIYEVGKNGARWVFVVRNTYSVAVPQAVLPGEASSSQDVSFRRPVETTPSNLSQARSFSPDFSNQFNRLPPRRLVSQSPSGFSFSSSERALTQHSELSDDENQVLGSNADTPTPRSTTTSRREADLPAVGRETSMIQIMIAKEHYCETCVSGVCYTPVKNRKHCMISPGSQAAWAIAIHNKTATIAKPHATCREWIQWQKDLQADLTAALGASTTGLSQSPASSTLNICFSAAGITATGNAPIESPVNDRLPLQNESPSRHAASSPFGSQFDEYELLESWFNYSVSRQKVFSNVDFEVIKKKLVSDHMAYDTAKDYILSGSDSKWAVLRQFDITIGLATRMRKCHKEWKLEQLRLGPGLSTTV